MFCLISKLVKLLNGIWHSMGGWKDGRMCGVVFRGIQGRFFFSFFSAALNDDTLKASFGTLGREGGWDDMFSCMLSNFSKTK